MIDKTFERIWLALEKEGFYLLAIKEGVWAKVDICAAKNGKKYRVVCVEIPNRVYPVMLAGEIKTMIEHPGEHQEHFSWLDGFSFVLILDDLKINLPARDKIQMEKELNDIHCPWIYLSQISNL